MSGDESELFDAEIISSSDLNIGDCVRFGWLPNRLCAARYLGNNQFVAEECHNSKMQAGDTFSCLQFILGKGLIMSSFTHIESDSDSRIYIAGHKNGLTTLQLQPKR